MSPVVKMTWIAVLCVGMVVKLGVSLEEGTEPPEQDSREPCARWMRGVGGTPGFDGIPGRDGRDGREGEKGDIAAPGDLFEKKMHVIASKCFEMHAFG